MREAVIGDARSAWNHTTIRELEHASIREFVESCAPLLGARVLDYGCGLQPYRDIVEAAGGQYLPYDRASYPGNVSGENVGWPDAFDSPLRGENGGPYKVEAILCTQVLQYVRDPVRFIHGLRRHITDEGVLVMTVATNWDEVEPTDLHRFTQAGIRWLLSEAKLTPIHIERRAEVNLGGFRFPLGYGVVAHR